MTDANSQSIQFSLGHLEGRLKAMEARQAQHETTTANQLGALNDKFDDMRQKLDEVLLTIARANGKAEAAGFMWREMKWVLPFLFALGSGAALMRIYLGLR